MISLSAVQRAAKKARRYDCATCIWFIKCFSIEIIVLHQRANIKKTLIFQQISLDKVLIANNATALALFALAARRGRAICALVPNAPAQSTTLPARRERERSPERAQNRRTLCVTTLRRSFRLFWLLASAACSSAPRSSEPGPVTGNPQSGLPKRSGCLTL